MTAILTGFVALLFLASVPSLAAASANTGGVHAIAATPGIVRFGPAGATPENCNDCWTGYSINSTKGAFNSGSVTITVPTVKCSKSLDKTYGAQLSSWGVYSDGLYPDTDIASASVLAECVSGTVYFYGSAANSTITYYTSFTPAPGDVVKLSFKVSGGNYKMVINDTTQAASNSFTLGATGAPLNSAECISDMFYNTSTGSSFPSVKFSTVSFNDCKVDGKGLKPTPIGSASGTLYEWTCVNSAGSANLATPTALAANNMNFKVKWVANGP